jgi:hypothetical protein
MCIRDSFHTTPLYTTPSSAEQDIQRLSALVRAQQITIDKLEQALAVPVQEPVAWMDVDEKGAISGLRYWSEPDNRHEVALYTTLPQRTWVGLTDEEMKRACYEVFSYDPYTIARAIEAKLKEKNT